KTWNYLWYENGKRRTRVVGTLREYPTKGAARSATLEFMPQQNSSTEPHGTTVNAIAQRYLSERLPSRFSTARMYRSWLRNHILPEWGEKPIADVHPREVELWLRSLVLAPKSKAHIRAMLRILLDFAMWCGALQISRNP